MSKKTVRTWRGSWLSGILVMLALGAVASASAAQNFHLFTKPRRQQGSGSVPLPECAWCQNGLPGYTHADGTPAPECGKMATKKPVRYMTGELIFDTPDITSPGFVRWGWGRSFPTGQTYFGDNWFNNYWASFLPHLTNQAIQYGGHAGASFSGAGPYTPQFYYQETLVDDTAHQVFVYTDTLGAQTRFADGSNTSVPFGHFVSYTDPAGNVISATWDQSTFFWPVCTQLTTSQTANGSTYTEVWTLSYYNLGDYRDGLCASVALAQQLNGGTLNTIRTVNYTYYDGVNFTSNGGVGALWRASITGVGFAETKYYRYAAQDSFGFIGLQYAVNGKAYERLKAAVGGTDTAVDNAAPSTVAAYANYGFTYDTTTSLHGVISESVQGEDTGGGCSCGGSPGLGTYTYAYTTSGNGNAINNWNVKVVETLPDSNINTVYTNYLGEVLLQDFKDTTTLQHWVTTYTYDATTARPVQTAMPSAVVSYSDSSANLNIVLATSSGLIKSTNYYATTGSGGVAGFVSGTTLQNGSGGSPVNQTAQQYLINTDVNGSKSYPISQRTIYADGVTAINTTYSYTFINGNTSQIQDRTTTYPLIPATHNSGDGTHQDVEQQYFDAFGRPTWTMDADGFIHYKEYDPFTSALTKQIVDVDTTKTTDFQNKPTGWTTPTGGGAHLITTYAVDAIGRTTQVTTQTFNSQVENTYVVYNDASREARTYPGWVATVPTGPTQIRREDWTRSYLETLTTSDAPTVSNGKPTGQETITTANLQTLARTYFDTSDRPSYADLYYDLSSGGFSYNQNSNVGTLNTNFNRTLYGYDKDGNLNRIVDGTGTVNRAVFDSRSRISSTWIGTNDTPTSGDWSPTNNSPPCNMLQTRAYRYDDPTNSGNGGVGDDTLTHVTVMSESGNYLTRYQYDFRDRVISELGPDAVAVNYTLDNLGQITLVQTYANTTETGVPWTFTPTHLRQQKDASYDERQRIYLTDLFEVSTGGTVSNKLPTNFWYNKRGLRIKTQNPNKLFDKTVYDGARRIQKTYTCYNDSESTYSAAFSASGNTVIEQTINYYDKSSNLLTVARFKRNDNDISSTGDLLSNASFLQVSVNWFDAANRLVTTANYGRDNGSTRYVYNSSGGLIDTNPPDGLPDIAEGTAPVPPGPTSQDYFVTSFGYDASGFPKTTTDNLGRVQQKTYDRAGNLLSTVDNFTGTGIPTASSLDTNVTVQRTYLHGLQLATLVAVNPKGGTTIENQTTTYSYASAICLWWPTTTAYPDNSSGSDQEVSTYDRLGRKTTYTDPRGVVHTYAYDTAARFLSDAITTLPSGVDGAVLRIQRNYDDWSRLLGVTSYNAASAGTVVNDYQRAYNQYYQISQSQQNHSGAVVSGSPKVQYTFADGVSGTTAKYIRLATEVYPATTGARTLTFNYLADGKVGDHLVRLDSIADGVTINSSTVAAQYTYYGASSVLKVAHPQVSNGLDLDLGINAQYSGLDRFARVTEQKWVNDAGTTNFDDYQYVYDRMSNRTSRAPRPTSPPAARDEYYQYDGLNRLKDFDRGALSGGTITDGNSNLNQHWTALESAGNWRTFTFDADGSGGGANETQTRTINIVNEVTAESNSPALTWISPTYDAAGNALSGPKPGAEGTRLWYTYDAWNRLVLIQNDNGGARGTTLVSHAYDGMNRRTIKNVSGGTTYHYYYDEKWRVIEIRYNTNTAPSEHYVWDPRYIDAPVVRFRATSTPGTFNETLFYTEDANQNITSLIDTSHVVQERYTYDPYGNPHIWANDWTTVRTTSSFANELMFAGYRRDAESALYHVRNRIYHPTLGCWLQRDPMGYVDGMNLEAYALCNPISFVDALGLQEGSTIENKCCNEKKKSGNVQGEAKMKLGTADDPEGEANPSNNTSRAGKAMREFGEQLGALAAWLKMMQGALETSNPMLNEAKKDAKEKAKKTCEEYCKPYECQGSGENCEGHVRNGKFQDGKRTLTQGGKAFEPKTDGYKIEGDDFLWYITITYTYDCVCSCRLPDKSWTLRPAHPRPHGRFFGH